VPTTQASTISTTQVPITISTTQAPTTQAPTTQAPTTQVPTTQALTTQAPTTTTVNRQKIIESYIDCGSWIDNNNDRSISDIFIDLRIISPFKTWFDYDIWFNYAVNRAIQENYDTFGFQENYDTYGYKIVYAFFGNYNSVNPLNTSKTFRYDKYGPADINFTFGHIGINKVFSKITPSIKPIYLSNSIYIGNYQNDMIITPSNIAYVACTNSTTQYVPLYAINLNTNLIDKLKTINFSFNVTNIIKIIANTKYTKLFCLIEYMSTKLERAVLNIDITQINPNIIQYNIPPSDIVLNDIALINNETEILLSFYIGGFYKINLSTKQFTFIGGMNKESNIRLNITKTQAYLTNGYNTTSNISVLSLPGLTLLNKISGMNRPHTIVMARNNYAYVLSINGYLYKMNLLNNTFVEVLYNPISYNNILPITQHMCLSSTEKYSFICFNTGGYKHHVIAVNNITNTIVKSFIVGDYPQKIILINNKLYIVCIKSTSMYCINNLPI
jgi:hypothetical protein